MRIVTKRLVLELLAAAAISALAGGVATAEDALPKMVVIHKIAGIPGVQMMANGVVKGGKDYKIDASLTGPAQLDPAQQVKLIEDMIAQHVAVIGLVPLDANVTAAPLKRAHDAGIKVLTLEGEAQANRDWNVDMVGPKTFGETEMQRLAAAMGEKGEYVVFVGTLTTPLHNEWADYAVAYQKAHYPNMKQATDRLPGGDEVDVSQRTALDVMKAHPHVAGFLVEGSNGPIGIGNAVRELHKGGKVAIVGTCLPSQAKNLLKEHIITECTWWDPVESGYALVAVARQMLDGKPFVDGADIGGIGKASIDSNKKLIQFNQMLEITPENVDSFVAKGL